MPEKSEVVRRVPSGDGKTRAKTSRIKRGVVSNPPKTTPHAEGKPPKIATTTTMKSRVASYGGMGTSGVIEGSGGNFYSPELSTDFLELPQSQQESWNYYRFFYRTEPFVGQAIDLHTELPLSKIRISVPKAKNRELALKSTRFCEKWAARVGLLRRLISIVHEYALIGIVYVWVEDTNPDPPPDIEFEVVRELTPEGQLIEKQIRRPDADQRLVKWLNKNYKGWTSVKTLPPEQIRKETFNFTEEKIIELILDSKTKDIIQRAQQGEKDAQRIVTSMPKEIVASAIVGKNVSLNTDPDAGSFVYCMENKKSDYEQNGHSILERCLLPGTPITVLRGGTIQQVPVEAVDVSTDLLLTHKGNFHKAEMGSRPVSEVVTVLHVEGLDPISLTSDHRVLVVGENGSEAWVEAKDLRVGDKVLKAPCPGTFSLNEMPILNGWLTRKIERIESIVYTGFVYSFNVEQDESLVAGNIAVHNCIRTLVFRDKIRQANTSIASRHMTPIRVVWGEDMDVADVESLREQIDLSLQDPDFSIVANYQINWEEMGSDQRLLDLSSEYDLTDRQLYAGLGVTEGLLSGESAYSGDRINLEVINTRYMLLRELLQDFVENYFFRPMCARMGFVEDDEDGEEMVIVPKLSFTRLALRDNNDTFDALFNLYNKGSLDIDIILELLNIDPVATREKLERDLFTLNDAVFNETLRGIYVDVGRKLAENSDVTEKIAKELGLRYEKPKEEAGRF